VRTYRNNDDRCPPDPAVNTAAAQSAALDREPDEAEQRSADGQEPTF
jgi:hypothetical protein